MTNQEEKFNWIRRRNLVEQFLRGDKQKEDLEEEFKREEAHAINSHKIMSLTNSCGNISIEELAEQIVESINHDEEES